jgi:hypothetical protein
MFVLCQEPKWAYSITLIGGSDRRRRQFKAEGFCRLEVMDQVEFGRLFNWNVGRLRPS